VSILGRSPQPDLEAAGVTVHRGDVAELSVVREACRGAQAVVHTAAKAGVWGTREDYFSANVTGTRNILRACREHRVSRLVFTSTPSVVFTGGEFRGSDETLPYGHDFLCPYAESKAEAEQLALSAHNPDGLRVCALRPHLIWGPGDPHLLPRVISRALKGRLRIVGEGDNRVDITHVENAALAHVLALDALDAGRAGGRAYFISQGEPVDLWPWINALLVRLGIPQVTRHVSMTVARRLGSVMESFWGALHLPGEPPMTRFTAVELAHSHWFDISAAREDLGYVPEVSTEQGLDDFAKHWLSGKA
jgi:nucleoside-diphosphate-sugar epimerase